MARMPKPTWWPMINSHVYVTAEVAVKWRKGYSVKYVYDDSASGFATIEVISPDGTSLVAKAPPECDGAVRDIEITGDPATLAMAAQSVVDLYASATDRVQRGVLRALYWKLDKAAGSTAAAETTSPAVPAE